MSGAVPSLVARLTRTPEELVAAEAEERQRQRAARIDALRVDRSRFNSPLLDQATRQLAHEYADEERVISRRREKTQVTKTEAWRRLTAPASLWRRLVWGER